MPSTSSGSGTEMEGEHHFTLEYLDDCVRRLKEQGVPWDTPVFVQIPQQLEGWTLHEFRNEEGDWRAIRPHGLTTEEIEGKAACVIFIDY